MNNKQMVDPIKLLRRYIMEDKPINQNDNNLIFGKVQLKLNTQTAWQPENNKKYSLGDLYLFLDCKQKKLKDNEYYKRISEMRKMYKFKLISINHQDEIEKYFFGKIETSKCINYQLKETQKVKQRVRQKKKQDYSFLIENKEILKKSLEINENDFKLLDYIKRWEKH